MGTLRRIRRAEGTFIRVCYRLGGLATSARYARVRLSSVRNRVLASLTDESIQRERKELATLLLWSLISLYCRYSSSNGFHIAVGQSSSNYILGHRWVELWKVGLTAGHINREVGWRLRTEGDREEIG